MSKVCDKEYLSIIGILIVDNILLGYRVFDSSKRTYYDYTDYTLIDNLRNGRFKLKNAKLDANGDLEFIECSEKRMPRIKADTQQTEQNAWFVIGKVLSQSNKDIVKYMLVNPTGKLGVVEESTLYDKYFSESIRLVNASIKGLHQTDKKAVIGIKHVIPLYRVA